MSGALNIAVAGLGTVGAGVVKLLQTNGDLIASRAGRPITVKAVSARDKNKKRDCDLSGLTWVDDARKLADVPGIDAVVEAIGGAEGVARDLAEAALKKGRHYITANKALIATHGPALARLAEQSKVRLSFEASVAGGIPVIKALREGLAGNHILAVRGIINGTCNYILSRMREAGIELKDALLEAQQKGYADLEDSGFDIDGHDAACKLAILAALAFGVEPDLKAVQVEGIRAIMPLDMQYADDLGCRIKLLGIAHESAAGIEQRVGPALVPEQSLLANVEGVSNAVLLRGDFAGDIVLQGAGAGAGPTASAVVADLIDIMRGSHSPAFGVPAARLKKAAPVREASVARHYLRLEVMDKPGVLADISGRLRDEGISIESFLSRGTAAAEAVPVVVTTHEAGRLAMQRAAAKIAKVPTVVGAPCLLSIED